MRIEFVYMNDRTHAINIQVQSFGVSTDGYVMVPAGKGVVIHFDVPEGGHPYFKEWDAGRALLSYTGPKANLTALPAHKFYRVPLGDEKV